MGGGEHKSGQKIILGVVGRTTSLGDVAFVRSSIPFTRDEAVSLVELANSLALLFAELPEAPLSAAADDDATPFK